MIWLLLAAVVALAQDTDEPADLEVDARVDELEAAVDARGAEVAELQALTADLLAALDIEDQGPPVPDELEDDSDGDHVDEQDSGTRDTAPLASPLSNYPERD